MTTVPLNKLLRNVSSMKVYQQESIFKKYSLMNLHGLCLKMGHSFVHYALHKTDKGFHNLALSYFMKAVAGM